MRDYDFDDDEPYVVIEKQSGGMGAFVVGLAIGAGLALLFAPQSGADTRRDIRRKARQAQDAASRMAGEVTDTVSDGFHEARRRVEEQIDGVRRAVDLKKEQVSRAVEAGRAAALQAREDLERRIAETKAAYEAGAEGTRGSTARRARSANGPTGGPGEVDGL